MKQKQLFKYAIAGILVLSIFSVLYVNSDSRSTFRAANTFETHHTSEVVIVDEDKEARNIPVPDVTVLGRIIDLAKRLVSHKP